MNKQNANYCPFLFLFLITLVSACSNPSQKPISNASPDKYPIINIDNSIKLSEIKLLSPNQVTGPVIGLFYNLPINQLYVVTGDGYLRIWNLNSNTVINVYSLNIVSSTSLSFDSNGQYISGAGFHEFKDIGFGQMEYFGKIGVWEINTGKLILCISSTCGSQRSSEEKPSADIIGAEINPTGQSVLYYDNGLIQTSNIKDRTLLTSDLAGAVGDMKYIGRVTFDATGKQIAIAGLAGEVTLWNTKKTDLLNFGRAVQQGNEQRIYHTVRSLVFSPEDHWLARIYDNQINVWDIEKSKVQQVNNLTGFDANFLSFDRFDQLLFIVTSGGIRILDIKKNRIIANYKMPEIQSFFVSQDNHLLFWGDSRGIIHIWGVT